MTRFAPWALAAAALVASSNIAAAQGPSAPGQDMITHTEIVRYSDLSTTDRAGARRLMSRIRTAVSNVCGGPLDLPADSWAIRAYTECVRQAQQDAMAQIDPAVLEVAKSKATAQAVASR